MENLYRTRRNLDASAADLLLDLSEMAVSGSRWLLGQAQEGLGVVSEVLAQTQGQIRHTVNGLRRRELARRAASCRCGGKVRRDDSAVRWRWTE